jgi:hypothetical protein
MLDASAAIRQQHQKRTYRPGQLLTQSGPWRPRKIFHLARPGAYSDCRVWTVTLQTDFGGLDNMDQSGQVEEKPKPKRRILAFVAAVLLAGVALKVFDGIFRLSMSPQSDDPMWSYALTQDEQSNFGAVRSYENNKNEAVLREIRDLSASASALRKTLRLYRPLSYASASMQETFDKYLSVQCAIAAKVEPRIFQTALTARRAYNRSVDKIPTISHTFGTVLFFKDCPKAANQVPK